MLGPWSRLVEQNHVPTGQFAHCTVSVAAELLLLITFSSSVLSIVLLYRKMRWATSRLQCIISHSISGASPSIPSSPHTILAAAQTARSIFLILVRKGTPCTSIASLAITPNTEPVTVPCWYSIRTSNCTNRFGRSSVSCPDMVSYSQVCPTRHGDFSHDKMSRCHDIRMLRIVNASIHLGLDRTERDINLCKGEYNLPVAQLMEYKIHLQFSLSSKLTALQRKLESVLLCQRKEEVIILRKKIEKSWTTSYCRSKNKDRSNQFKAGQCKSNADFWPASTDSFQTISGSIMTLPSATKSIARRFLFRGIQQFEERLESWKKSY